MRAAARDVSPEEELSRRWMALVRLWIPTRATAARSLPPLLQGGPLVGIDSPNERNLWGTCLRAALSKTVAHAVFSSSPTMLTSAPWKSRDAWESEITAAVGLLSERFAWARGC